MLGLGWVRHSSYQATTNVVEQNVGTQKKISLQAATHSKRLRLRQTVNNLLCIAF